MKAEKPLKRAGIAGILFGVLACLLCALPMAFGIAGVAAFAWLAILEKIGLFTALIGVSLLAWLWLSKHRKEVRVKEEKLL